MKPPEGDDILHGRKREDLLSLDAGAAMIALVNGESVATPYTEKDLLFGHAGNDVLIGGPNADTLMGGDGDDFADGGDGDDVIDGGLGNDVLRGGRGKDYINGNAGDDVIYGGSDADMILGFLGSDIIYGDDGSDFLDGGEGDDQLFGGAGDDVLKGGADANLIDGQAGDDLIIGGVDSDMLLGGEGRNIVLGGPGIDQIINGDGDSTLAKAITGESVLTGSGLVQFIDDFSMPNATPRVDDAIAFKAWIDEKFAANKVTTEQALNETKSDFRGVNILQDTKRRELQSRKAIEDYQARIDRFQVLVKEPSKATKSELSDYDKNGNGKLDDQELGTILMDLRDDAFVLEASIVGFSLGIKTGVPAVDKVTGADGGGGIAGQISDWTGKITDAIKDPAGAINAIKNGAIDLAEETEGFLTGSFAKIDEIMTSGIPNVVELFDVPGSNIFNDFKLPNNLDLGNLDAFFENLSIEAITKGLLNMPFQGIDWTPPFVDNFNSWWNEKVEDPFNNWWQNEVEPAWHDAEDGWHNWARHVETIDYNDIFVNRSYQISSIWVKPSSREGYFVVETHVFADSGLDTNKPRLKVYTSTDVANDSATEESNVTLRAGADGTKDTVTVRVSSEGKTFSNKETSKEFEFPVTKRTVVYERKPDNDDEATASGQVGRISDISDAFVSAVRTIKNPDFEYYYVEVELPYIAADATVTITIRNTAEQKFDLVTRSLASSVSVTYTGKQLAGNNFNRVSLQTNTPNDGTDIITVEVRGKAGAALQLIDNQDQRLWRRVFEIGSNGPFKNETLFQADLAMRRVVLEKELITLSPQITKASGEVATAANEFQTIVEAHKLAQLDSLDQETRLMFDTLKKLSKPETILLDFLSTVQGGIVGLAVIMVERVTTDLLAVGGLLLASQHQRDAAETLQDLLLRRERILDERDYIDDRPCRTNPSNPSFYE